jgi:hypothetical protein
MTTDEVRTYATDYLKQILAVRSAFKHERRLDESQMREVEQGTTLLLDVIREHLDAEEASA